MSLTPDSNDQEILDQTHQDESFIWVTLEDGHQLKAKKPIKFIDWCQAVRDNIQGRIENEEARRRAQRERGPEPAGHDPKVSVPASKRGNPEDPLEYAESQEEYWLEVLHELKAQAEKLSEDLEAANASYTKWKKVVEVLSEQHSVGDSVTDPGPGSAPVRSGVRSDGNQKGSKRPKQGAVHGVSADGGTQRGGADVQADD